MCKSLIVERDKRQGIQTTTYSSRDLCWEVYLVAEGALIAVNNLFIYFSKVSFEIESNSVH